MRAMRHSTLITSCLALSAAGCVTLRGGHGSSSAEWRQVTTPHFLVRTDFDDATTMDAAKKLESTRDDLVSAAWPSFEFPEGTRTEVYVLSDSLDFENLFGRRTMGVFSGGARPTFFLYGHPDRWDQRETLAAESTSIVRHEMAHQLAAAVFAREPRWFSEGLAQFLETVHESNDHKSVIVGAVNIECLKKYNTYRTITVRRTLAWNEQLSALSEGESHGLYGMSWFLVHWLYNTRPEPFARYQVELSRGTEVAKAFDLAFPGFDPDAADMEVQNYSKRGEYEEFAMPLHVHPFAAQPETLSPALARVARARVLIAAASNSQTSDREPRLVAAQAELARAIELDPTTVEAIELRDGVPRDERVAFARKATAAHPDDPRAFSPARKSAPRFGPGSRRAGERVSSSGEARPERPAELEQPRVAARRAAQGDAGAPSRHSRGEARSRRR